MWPDLSEGFLVAHKDTRLSCARGRPGAHPRSRSGVEVLGTAVQILGGPQGEGSAGDAGFEAGPGGPREGPRRQPPFSPPTPRVQVGWPQSLTPSLPWTFCGSDCTKRSRRPAAR